MMFAKARGGILTDEEKWRISEMSVPRFEDQPSACNIYYDIVGTSGWAILMH